MIYTLGHYENYMKQIKQDKEDGVQTKKLGPRKMLGYGPYYGGIAFQTPHDAIVWKKENKKSTWEPFVLDGDWFSDVYWSEEDNHFRINRDLPIIGPANSEDF